VPSASTPVNTPCWISVSRRLRRDCWLIVRASTTSIPGADEALSVDPPATGDATLELVEDSAAAFAVAEDAEDEAVSMLEASAATADDDDSAATAEAPIAGAGGAAPIIRMMKMIATMTSTIAANAPQPMSFCLLVLLAN